MTIMGEKVYDEDWYKQKILSDGHTTEKEVQEWLKRNPPPKYWEEGQYAWAYCEMETGGIAHWWRKKVYKWDI